MNKNYLLLFIIMVALCSSVYGQKKFGKIAPADFATPPEAADTTVDAVFVYEIGETNFSATSTSFVLETTFKARIHILTEKGKDYANKSIYYYYNPKNTTNNNDDVRGVEATAYNLVDGKVVKTAMSNKYIFKEQTNDYYRCVKFTIPDVKVGTIIEYKYTVASPRFADLPTWVLQHQDPVRYSCYRAIIPDWFNYHIEERGYKIIKGQRNYESITIPVNGGAMTEKALQFIIEGENLRPFKPEGFIFCQSDYLQRVDFELVSATIPGRFTKEFTTTWNDVREYLSDEGYYNTNLHIKAPFAEDMAALGLEGKPVSVKASMIYALLKKKLKWDNTYALRSNNPLKAVKEGKGSNADLNFIYLAMLQKAGIKATPLLIRCRKNGRLPFTYASIDKLETFIVAIADENGSLLFADCSADYGDINILPVNLLAEGILYDPSIATNPASRPTRGEIYDLVNMGGNASTARIDCIISEDGKLSGQRMYSHVGENAMYYKQTYHEYEDSIAMIESKEKNLECTVKSFRVKNADGTGRMTEERIRFTKDLFVDDGKIYFNPLVFADEKTNHFTKSERVLPIEFPYPQSTKITTCITIPNGYALETMPQNQHLTLDDHLGVEITFEMQGNVLVTKYENAVENTFIPADKYQRLQDYWNEMLKLNSMTVCLKKL